MIFNAINFPALFPSFQPEHQALLTVRDLEKRIKGWEQTANFFERGGDSGGKSWTHLAAVCRELAADLKLLLASTPAN